MTTPDWINLRDGVVDRTGTDGPFPADGRYVRVGELPSQSAQPADSGRVTDTMVTAFKEMYFAGPVMSLSPARERIRRAIEAALAAQGQGDAVTTIMRDVCETDPADPDKPDTVCINAVLLHRIIERHITTTPASPASVDDAAPLAPPETRQVPDGEVICEHSGCGHGVQCNQIDVKLYRGDKVLMVRGRIGKAMTATEKVTP